MAIHSKTVDKIEDLITECFPDAHVYKEGRKLDGGYETVSFSTEEIKSNYFLKEAFNLSSFVMKPTRAQQIEFTFY